MNAKDFLNKRSEKIKKKVKNMYMRNEMQLIDYSIMEQDEELEQDNNENVERLQEIERN